ncbi:Outer dense fiber protein 3-like protein 1 [Manis javanica]|nr:Outer dense fiber protein 3-like protein 1 [Manis javanica]
MSSCPQVPVEERISNLLWPPRTRTGSTRRTWQEVLSLPCTPGLSHLSTRTAAHLQYDQVPTWWATRCGLVLPPTMSSGSRCTSSGYLLSLWASSTHPACARWSLTFTTEAPPGALTHLFPPKLFFYTRLSNLTTVLSSRAGNCCI